MTTPPKEPASLHQVLVLTRARDAEDRPLLESKSPLIEKAELAEARVTCPFEQSPSRFQHAKPMNQAALEQVRAHFGAFLGLLARLREARAQAVGRDQLLLEDWHRICLQGEVLPRLLLLRHHEGLGADARLARYFDHRLPISVGIVFKTVRGLLRLTNTMRDEPERVLACLHASRRRELGLDSVPKRKPKKSKGTGRRPTYDRGAARAAVAGAAWTPEDLVHVTEALELMVGDEEVCAAPPGMLTATFAALVDGRRDPRTEAVEREVEAALADPNALDRFTDAIAAVYAELDRYRGAAQAAHDKARADVEHSARSAGDPAATFDRHLDASLRDERRFLDRLAALQPEVLASAGCSALDPPLDLALVDDLVAVHLRRVAERERGVSVRHLEDGIEVRRGSAPPRLIGDR